MWLFTKQGFYSVVLAADRDGQPPDTLAVRARRRQDLESLRRMAPALGQIVSLRHRDYPFRCFIRREGFSRLLADLGTRFPRSGASSRRERNPKLGLRHCVLIRSHSELRPRSRALFVPNPPA